MSDELLDLYLDGQLDDERRRAFEQALERDPALRAQVELAREVDGSLARLATPPDADALLARARERTKVIRPRFGTRRAFALLAAALLLAIGLTLLPWPSRSPSHDDVAAIYERRVRSGFAPDWVCRDEAELVGTFRDRLGQPLRLAAAPGVEAVGLGYEAVLSPATIVILAKVGGEPALVFVDRLERDATPKNPARARSLRLHRRVLGELVLYELSPFDAPRVLPIIERP